jgi:hypothetical protein
MRLAGGLNDDLYHYPNDGCERFGGCKGLCQQCGKVGWTWQRYRCGKIITPGTTAGGMKLRVASGRKL